MHIKLTSDGPEIYTIGQLRRDNPNTSFPRRVSDDTLASYGVYPYAVAEKPDHDPATQVIEPGDFVETESGWVRGWTVRDKTADELSQALAQHAQSVKAECRRRILAVCNDAAQTNIAQAGVLYSAMRLNGMSDADALAHAGLIHGDLTRTTEFQNWRGAMVSNCRAYADDVSLEYLSDDAWPDVPAGVRELAARF
jgi:hypothetical protein